jgi:hypothetical protein
MKPGAFPKKLFSTLKKTLAYYNASVVAILGLDPRVVPTIVIYNASAVKIYNNTSSLVRFENKNIYFFYEKRSSLLQTRFFPNGYFNFLNSPVLLHNTGV